MQNLFRDLTSERIRLMSDVPDLTCELVFASMSGIIRFETDGQHLQQLKGYFEHGKLKARHQSQSSSS